MKMHQIVTGARPARLVRLAGRELARYAGELFQQAPRLVTSRRPGTGLAVILDARAAGLSDQGYALGPIDRHTFAIEAGSPIALLWAVYDLAERWGVRYELHGDIVPDRPGAMKLPGRRIVCEPDLKIRSFRTYNVFANNECAWPARDYGLLLDQLAKLRYNAILFCVRPYDPLTDLRFRGARKTLAEPNFGWRPRIRPDHPGYELFVKSGDAKRGVFVNPDLHGHATYDKALAAGKTYMRKICRMAHARGMQVMVKAPAADFDPAIRKRLLALTKPRHKIRRAPIYRIRYGIWREGPDVETGRCMSIHNPVFLDVIAANMQATIDAFGDADALFFGSSEFGGSGADCDRAWAALDRKYGLSRIKSLPALVREARRHAEGPAERAERELLSDIVVLYALDRLINERGFDLSKSRRNVTISPASLSTELNRFLPSIFPHGTPYFASFGYMPSYVATRTNTLKHKDSDSIRHILVVSAEDDNVGMLPQLTGPAVHKIIEALRDVGAHGFQTRQWMHSNLLPTFHYMGHAAWEKGWTPTKAYRHLYEPVCGPRSLAHILRAFGRIERITQRLHQDVLCVSFPVPRWITGLWEDWPEKHTPGRLEQIAGVYRQSSDDMLEALGASRRAGRDTLVALERHMRHADYYCRALAQLARARAAEDVATALIKPDVADPGAETLVADTFVAGKFDKLDAARTAVAMHLDNAEALMRQACEIFAQGVRDRCDLGALATLNSYNLDVIAALARIAHAQEQMFSVRET